MATPEANKPPAPEVVQTIYLDKYLGPFVYRHCGIIILIYFQNKFRTFLALKRLKVSIL